VYGYNSDSKLKILVKKKNLSWTELNFWSSSGIKLLLDVV
jgi:hypothetical protein